MIRIKKKKKIDVPQNITSFHNRMNILMAMLRSADYANKLFILVEYQISAVQL